MTSGDTEEEILEACDDLGKRGETRVSRDCSFVPSHPDPDNQTGTILITTLLGQ